MVCIACLGYEIPHPVTPADVRVLRRVYEEWAAGNLAAGRELLSPEMVSVWAGDFRLPGLIRVPAVMWLSCASGSAPGTIST